MPKPKRLPKLDITRKYCKLHPRMANRTLARLLHDDHPELGTIEQWRSAVRQQRGLHGNSHVNNRIQKLAATGGDHDPRILIFDIETTPMLSFHWRTFKENIAPVQVVEYSQVLCWAAKWLGSDTVLFDSQKDDEDDRRICESLWELCDQADVIVAHNGQAFDMSFMRTRWLYYKMTPPSPVKIVDTLKIARHQFGFPNNKLETLVRYLDLGSKLAHHGFQLWLDCLGRSTKKAYAEGWKVMEEYNIQDVLILEEFYLRVRAWDAMHPNLALFYPDDEGEKSRCVCCGSTALKKLVKKTPTAVSLFDTLRCKNCGKIMRTGSREKLTRKILRNII